MEKKPTSSAVMGLLVGLALIVCSLVVLFGNFYTERWSQVLGFAILFGGILGSVLVHAKEVDGRESFGGYFGFGFKVTAAATVIMILFVVLEGYIFPDVKTTIMEMSRVEMSKNPNMTGSQVDQAMQWMEKKFYFDDCFECTVLVSRHRRRCFFNRCGSVEETAGTYF